MCMCVYVCMCMLVCVYVCMFVCVCMYVCVCGLHTRVKSVVRAGDLCVCKTIHKDEGHTRGSLL